MPSIRYPFLLAGLAVVVPAHAEEGMWTFDAFPAARVARDLGTAPDAAWLARVQGAAVRLTDGCSASFVSSAGLILTNHHCAVGCLQNLSSAADDLVANGFVAADRTAERKCPGQQAEVVTKIVDVTPDLKAAIGSAMGGALVKARDARIAELEKTACPDTALTRCQVVTLFGGGQYKLYAYRKYDDVRIAWAPEFQAAFFGGDPDNFNFPRYALDAAFLRAYENGRPVATPDHLRWSARSPKAGEATFVVGNPGTTRRLFTATQRQFMRADRLPVSLVMLSEFRGRLLTKMAESPDRQREGGDMLFGVENSYKANWGRFRSLNDAGFTAKMDAAEARLRQAYRPAADAIDPWTRIDRAVAAYRDFQLPYMLLETGAGYQSQTFGYARDLVRAAAERAKPDRDRLPGYTDSALPLLEKRVLDPAPVYPWLEQATLEFWLSKTREYLGPDDPQVKALLGKESPEALAARLAAGTKLGEPSYRRELWVGGARAIAASDDPMIRLAVSLDPAARALKKRYDAEYDGPVTTAQADLATARFAAQGDAIYPDATFTLRISYGRVAGWTERGLPVPPVTRMAGAFDRATGQQPFKLARAFEANRSRIKGDTVYDFTTTNDIIGGNSGSPVIDREGALIGAAFDGNIHSLGGDYGYDGTLNRTVVVSAAAVQQGLTVIYPAPALVRELAAK